eukprot:g6501.t1
METLSLNSLSEDSLSRWIDAQGFHFIAKLFRRHKIGGSLLAVMNASTDIEDLYSGKPTVSQESLVKVFFALRDRCMKTGVKRTSTGVFVSQLTPEEKTLVKQLKTPRPELTQSDISRKLPKYKKLNINLFENIDKTDEKKDEVDGDNKMTARVLNTGIELKGMTGGISRQEAKHIAIVNTQKRFKEKYLEITKKQEEMYENMQQKVLRLQEANEKLLQKELAFEIGNTNTIKESISKKNAEVEEIMKIRLEEEEAVHSGDTELIERAKKLKNKVEAIRHSLQVRSLVIHRNDSLHVTSRVKLVAPGLNHTNFSEDDVIAFTHAMENQIAFEVEKRSDKRTMEISDLNEKRDAMHIAVLIDAVENVLGGNGITISFRSVKTGGKQIPKEIELKEVVDCTMEVLRYAELNGARHTSMHSKNGVVVEDFIEEFLRRSPAMKAAPDKVSFHILERAKVSSKLYFSEDSFDLLSPFGVSLEKAHLEKIELHKKKLVESTTDTSQAMMALSERHQRELKFQSERMKEIYNASSKMSSQKYDREIEGLRKQLKLVHEKHADYVKQQAAMVRDVKQMHVERIKKLRAAANDVLKTYADAKKGEFDLSVETLAAKHEKRIKELEKLNHGQAIEIHNLLEERESMKVEHEKKLSEELYLKDKKHKAELNSIVERQATIGTTVFTEFEQAHAEKVQQLESNAKVWKRMYDDEVAHHDLTKKEMKGWERDQARIKKDLEDSCLTKMKDMNSKFEKEMKTLTVRHERETRTLKAEIERVRANAKSQILTIEGKAKIEAMNIIEHHRKEKADHIDRLKKDKDTKILELQRECRLLKKAHAAEVERHALTMETAKKELFEALEEKENQHRDLMNKMKDDLESCRTNMVDNLRKDILELRENHTGELQIYATKLENVENERDEVEAENERLRLNLSDFMEDHKSELNTLKEKLKKQCKEYEDRIEGLVQQHQSRLKILQDKSNYELEKRISENEMIVKELKQQIFHDKGSIEKYRSKLVALKEEHSKRIEKHLSNYKTSKEKYELKLVELEDNNHTKLQNCRESYERKINNLVKEHKEELDSLEKKHSTKLQQLKQGYERKIDDLLKEHLFQIKEVEREKNDNDVAHKAKRREEVNDLKEKHNTKFQEHIERHEGKIADLRKEHQSQIEK